MMTDNAKHFLKSFANGLNKMKERTEDVFWGTVSDPKTEIKKTCTINMRLRLVSVQVTTIDDGHPNECAMKKCDKKNVFLRQITWNFKIGEIEMKPATVVVPMCDDCVLYWIDKYSDKS